MCGPALRLCLLLWVVGATTQSQITAPASLTAEAGHPIVLSCNITTATGDTVRQVRWLNKHSKLLLAYEQRVPVRISYQEPNVKLTASNNNGSYITIKKVHPADDGCYQCVFDVFPSGQKNGSTCVSVTGKVHLEGNINKTVVIGRPVVLSCWYSLGERVRQVLWRKTAEQGDTTTVASYAKHGHHAEELFKGRVSLSRTLGETKLTFSQVRMEDEACYTCEFHAFPDGTRSATTCLSVYVLPEPEVGHVTSPSGVTEANCTTQSRPAAHVTWDTGGDNRTLGPPILSLYEQGDGTTIVTSTLLFQSGLLSEQSVKCVVRHQGLEKTLTLPLNSDARPAIIILISVCSVALVLLLCLCVCLCKSFICSDD
ncbi:poliovirus receptor homolog isoform X2 [Nematolebias whitei]|uniref:poliovirus receptor homolog isoform X2 n=1 Tax=Nematolebias whitei TaxID=451745 RepID=UPI00189AFDE2|nr:poliovirus receptor homolog isoform X2 [Nematolebias whitei]